MILTITIGNAGIIAAGYRQKTLLFRSILKTDPAKTEFEYAILLRDILTLHHSSDERLQGCIISSVVPPLSNVIQSAIKLLDDIPVLLVGPGIKTGLNICTDDPAQLGSELVAMSVGAMTKYPLPALIIHLGSVTKLFMVDKAKRFIGGSFIPGVLMGLNALSSKTAQLPRIELGEKVPVIGTNTIDCMRSGVILGTASMLDGMIDRYTQSIGAPESIIACGEIAPVIISHCSHAMIIDQDLPSDGLCEIYYKNQPS